MKVFVSIKLSFATNHRDSYIFHCSIELEDNFSSMIQRLIRIYNIEVNKLNFPFHDEVLIDVGALS